MSFPSAFNTFCNLQSLEHLTLKNKEVGVHTGAFVFSYGDGEVGMLYSIMLTLLIRLYKNTFW